MESIAFSVLAGSAKRLLRDIFFLDKKKSFWRKLVVISLSGLEIEEQGRCGMKGIAKLLIVLFFMVLRAPYLQARGVGDTEGTLLS